MSPTTIQSTPTLSVPRPVLQRLVALLASASSLRTLVYAHTRTVFSGGPEGVMARATNEVADLVWRVAEMTASAPIAFSLPSRQFRELVTAFDGASVSADVQADRGSLQLSCGQYAGRLPADMESTSVLPLPALPSIAWSVRVSRAALRRAIAAVRYASPRASDMARQATVGLYVAVRGAALSVTATDGHRLSHATVTVDAPVDAPVHIQFPLEAVQVLAGVLDMSQGEWVTLAGERYADGRWLVSGDEFTLLIAGLGEATFPAFSRLLPTATSHPMQVSANRAGMLGALTRVSLSSASGARRVTLAPAEDLGLFDGIRISACAADMGEASEVVQGQGKLALLIGVNPDYLAEAARQGTSESIALAFRSPDAPVALSDSAEGAHIIHLVMPVRFEG